MLSIQSFRSGSLSLYGLEQQAYLQASDSSGLNTPTSSEQISLSNLGRTAAYTGLDLENSSRWYHGEQLQFDFQYTDSQIQNIHATGFQELTASKYEFHLSFEVEESLITENSASARTLKFDLSFSMEQFQFRQINLYEQKEDINHYLYRLARTIAKYASDSKKEISELILDLEDAKELFAIDNGKIMKDLLAAIGIVYITNQMLDKDKEDVTLYVPREKHTIIDAQSMDYSSIHFNVSVSEINAESDWGNLDELDTETESITDQEEQPVVESLMAA